MGVCGTAILWNSEDQMLYQEWNSWHRPDQDCPFLRWCFVVCRRPGCPAVHSYQRGRRSYRNAYKGSTKENSVEVLIIYDSFPFTATQRRYPTYKREMCAMVKFVTKYDYFVQASVPTSYHSYWSQATYPFLTSDTHKGISRHWANQLRRLKVSIQCKHLFLELHVFSVKVISHLRSDDCS